MYIQYIRFEIQLLKSVTNSFNELIQIFTHHLFNIYSYSMPDASIWSPEVDTKKQKYHCFGQVQSYISEVGKQACTDTMW